MLIRAIHILMLIASPLALADGSSYQPNGNYANIGAGYMTSTTLTPLCIATDCYTTQSGPVVSGSLQLSALPNLVFGISESSLTANNATSTLKSSGSNYSMGVIGGFGPFDAGIVFSSLHSSIKSCRNFNGLCTSTSDTGADFGAIAKVWLGSHLNVGAAVDKYSYSASPSNYTSTSYFVSWLPGMHHAFSLQYSTTVDQNNISIANGGAISYAFLF